MRRLFLLSLILVLSLSSLFSAFMIGTDLRAIDSAFFDSMRIDIEPSYRYKDLRFSIPLAFSMSYSESLYFIDGGFSVALYPFDSLGLYLGATLFSAGYILGDLELDDSFILTSKAFVGWSFLFPYFYIEPQLTFFDIFSEADSSASLIKSGIRQYSKCRLSLYIGTHF